MPTLLQIKEDTEGEKLLLSKWEKSDTKPSLTFKVDEIGQQILEGELTPENLAFDDGKECWTIPLKLQPNQHGSVTIGVSEKDVTMKFVVTVADVNDPPPLPQISFDNGETWDRPDQLQSMVVGNPLTAILRNVSAGPNETDQQLQVKIKPDKVNGITIVPQLEADGTWTISFTGSEKGTYDLELFVFDGKLESDPVPLKLEFTAKPLPDMLDQQYEEINLAIRAIIKPAKTGVNFGFKSEHDGPLRSLKQKIPVFGSGAMTEPLFPSNLVLEFQAAGTKQNLTMRHGEESIKLGNINKDFFVTPITAFKPLTFLTPAAKKIGSIERKARDLFWELITCHIVYSTESSGFFTGKLPPEFNLETDPFTKTAGRFQSHREWEGFASTPPILRLKEQANFSSEGKLVLIGELDNDGNKTTFGHQRWPVEHYKTKTTSLTFRIRTDTCVHYSIDVQGKGHPPADEDGVSSGSLKVDVSVLKVRADMSDDEFTALKDNSDVLGLDLVREFNSAAQSKTVSPEQVKNWAARIGFSLGPQADEVAMVIKDWFVNKAQTVQTDLLGDLSTTANSPPAGFVDEYKGEHVKLGIKFWKQLKPVYDAQLQFDTNKTIKLTATICRVAELTDPKEPGAEPTYVYVPLVELATENPEEN